MAIVVVDYCKGNLASVARGIEEAGFEAIISADAHDILVADAVVLPGVGSFKDASDTMLATGQMDAIRKRVGEQGACFLGICLGLQLLVESGDEGCAEGESAEGLGLVAGTCRRLDDMRPDGTRVKVPHVGWNSVEYVAGRAGTLFGGVPDGTYFYFTHSYMVEPADSSVITSTTMHAVEFTSSIEQGNVFGTQFHPEKSSSAGLAVLANFGHAVYGR